MSYYTVKKIYPWLYSIYDPQAVFCYLIVGKKSALLYDTAYGIEPLDDAVRQVCGLPYEVILSHGHIDHVNGAFQFDETWIHPADYELCLRHTSKTARRKIVEQLDMQHKDEFIAKGAGNLKMLPDEKIFDLGGLTVEVIPMPGHTPGSVGLLIHEHKVLLDSDAACYHMWMFLEESLDMSIYINMLKQVKKLDFNTFFVGHLDKELPKADFDRYIAVAENIDVEKSESYPALTELGGRMYSEGDVSVVFNPNRL